MDVTLFVVIAGLGLDAKMLSGTSEPLKKRLGWVRLRDLGGSSPGRPAYAGDRQCEWQPAPPDAL